MPHEIEVGPKANTQLAELDNAIGASVERKIQWLAENASARVHRRLVGMPMIWRDFANFESAIIGFFIGFIPRKSSFAFTASNTALKCIGSCDINY